jgi:hypothetical protein
VNAPRICWLDVIQKIKNKKRSKYVALDFSTHFLFCFLIFVNLREGEKKKNNKGSGSLTVIENKTHQKNKKKQRSGQFN